VVELIHTHNRLTCNRYLKDILSNTAKSIDQVTVEPDGKWSTNAKGDGPSQTSKAPNGFGSDGDEDLIEITDARVASLKRSDAAQPSTPVIAMRTPSISSREPSTAPLRASSSKRPISQVIDLTLSDDDDEEAPPTKKQSTGYGTPMSMHQARPSC
jgi:E3 SUMO-protein ligase PIAS1